MNINATGRDIGGHQYPDRTRFKIGQGFGARALRFVSVNRCGRNAVCL